MSLTPADTRILRDLLKWARPNASGWFRVDCPKCLERWGAEDHGQALGVNLRDGWFMCWRCRWRGDIVDLIRDVRGDDGPAWTLDLSTIARTPKRWEPPAVPKDPGQLLPKGAFYALDQPTHPLSVRALGYLRGRGFDDRIVARLRPCVTLDAPRQGEPDTRGRVIIPVSYRGAVVSWVARTWGSQVPKVLNRKQAAGENRPVWGLDDIPDGEPISLAEGIFSAACVPFGVAILGTSLGEVQMMQVLAKKPRRIYVVLDGEPQAQQFAAGISMALRQEYAGEVCRVELPAKKDPNDVGAAGMVRIFDEQSKPTTLLGDLALLGGRFR